MSGRLLPLLDVLLLLCHLLSHGRIVKADKLPKLLPSLNLSRFSIAADRSLTKRRASTLLRTHVLSAHIKQKVVIVDFEHSWLSIRVVFGSQEAQRAQLHVRVDISTGVVNHLSTVLSLTQELLERRLTIGLIWLLRLLILTILWRFIAHIFEFLSELAN